MLRATVSNHHAFNSLLPVNDEEFGTQMNIPPKLADDLSNKLYDEQAEAFRRFLDAIGVLFPGLELRSQKRYSALYWHGKIVVYIEPQTYGVLLGFFRDYVRPVERRYTFIDFPEWNRSKGGLLGYRVGSDAAFHNAAILLFYSVEAVRR